MMTKVITLSELQSQKRWGIAKDKRPYIMTEAGLSMAKVNDPEGWTDYETATAWLSKYPEAHLSLLLGGEVETGFVLAGIDIDWKQSPDEHGVPEAVRGYFGDWLRATYTEWSVSGRGLHVLGIVPKALAVGGRKLSLTDTIGIELYIYPELGGRHFVFTGRLLDDAPDWLADISPLVKALTGTETGIETKRKPHKTVKGELERLRKAPQGTRHNTLVSVVGWLARMGWLTRLRGEVESAARECGLPEYEIQRVLADGEKWEREALEVPEVPVSEAPQGAGREGVNEYALALQLLNYLGGAVLYAEYRGLYLWDGTKWVRDGERVQLGEAYINMLTDFIAAFNDPLHTPELKKALKARNGTWAKRVLDLLPSLPQVPKLYANKHFDAKEGILNTPTGIVDLETGALLPHDPKLYCTKITNAGYEPDLLGKAAAPTWLSFLDSIFLGDRELIAWVQKAVGASVWGNPTEHVLFILWGGGANGKSTFLNTIRWVLGDYAGSVSVEVLLGDRNTLSERLNTQLYGLRFAFASETKEEAPLNESRIKALTGGDELFARYLYKEGFRFRPTHMLWLATNHKPRVRATDYGTWRRIRLIPFRAQFREGMADPYLFEKLKGEGRGILAWIVEGAMRWRKEGLGAPPEAVAQATAEYQKESDPLADWLESCCAPDPKALTPAKALYESYCRWAEAQNEKPLSQNAWGRRMSEKGYERVEGSGGQRLRKGIRLL